MVVNDIFNQLVFGELQHHAVADRLDNNGEVDSKHWKHLVTLLNRGLKELYKEFPLKLSEQIIDLYPQITLYELDNKYAVMNTASNEPIKYIHDSPRFPYKNDLLVIDSVFNEMGKEYFLNNLNEYYSIHTPQYNVIMHPYPHEEGSMDVKYRANHPIISVDNAFDPKVTELELPEYLTQALLLHMASNVQAGLDRQMSTQETNNYSAKYSNEIIKVKQQSLVHADQWTNDKLELNGWI